MKKLRFSVHITYEQFQAYYQGSAKFVQVTTENNLSLKFPASELQKYLVHNGINGRFEIEFDDKNKLIALNKI